MTEGVTVDVFASCLHRGNDVVDTGTFRNEHIGCSLTIKHCSKPFRFDFEVNLAFGNVDGIDIKPITIDSE